ncbi:2-amino-4-hydroxy-6-hydroxymethyldihydropteridine diphosphokinase [Hazenella sp. IB182357]|uniref:2-amino-4-hydroxy-6-hydroxymethyldihydropteridine diphosphokinase n=1 Tax=Polycladospora coralii TaxID=2771432 RepID=A0A926N652_9BACL|nr:2-amino-4-hydroxy-6-hydroxymethyldihydropteridine diphosphokinase [Polycladospora coralii]MBD1372439.1 2-amino-4-hydroxy-6-hydroxymethyldihydropteridine diphosphokinase [Polycladospora coralii]MBS7531761.1 2-amino-4-hydroxy-6-hydroxymethyldihydropteridine diphosphokinase [Polycladospora coralii]
MSRKVTAYLGLGANLGDPIQQLKQAIKCLHLTNGICVSQISSVYQTSPVGVTDQPDFYNLVVEIQTILTPHTLLDKVLQVEKRLKRIRDVKWGPRTIDIDILLYEKRQITQDDLKIPHPEMSKRAFVLIPLQEIAPDVMIPGLDQSVNQCMATLPPEQTIQKYAEQIALTGVRTQNRKEDFRC